MKRPRPYSTPLASNRIVSKRRAYAPIARVASPPTRAHPFFDTLPEDALIDIVHRVARQPALDVSTCGLLSLAAVSPTAHHLISTHIASSLSFCVYADAHWFDACTPLAARSLHTLCLHTPNYRVVGRTRHFQRPSNHHFRPRLNILHALTTVTQLRPPLRHLDVSGLHFIRRAAVSALTSLLTHVRHTLRVLKVDVTETGIANAVSRASLTSLHHLSMVNLNASCDSEMLRLLHALRRNPRDPASPCSIRHLSLDGCETLPTAFATHQPRLHRLLADLRALHIDFDGETYVFSKAVPAGLRKLQSIVCLPALRRLCLSGSGIPVTAQLVRDIHQRCLYLDQLHLVDCDVEPDGRVHQPGFNEESPNFRANDVIAMMGPKLTRYYPRWLTFQQGQIEALAKNCPNLTHVRLFIDVGSERWLALLCAQFQYSLVELSLYPARELGVGQGSLADSVLDGIATLQNVRHISVVNLGLSEGQLKQIVRQCGHQLTSFVFSPVQSKEGSCSERMAQTVAAVLMDVAKYARQVERLDVMVQHDWGQVNRSGDASKQLDIAMGLLESRCTILDMEDLRLSVKKMRERVEEEDEFDEYCFGNGLDGSSQEECHETRNVVNPHERF